MTLRELIESCGVENAEEVLNIEVGGSFQNQKDNPHIGVQAIFSKGFMEAVPTEIIIHINEYPEHLRDH